MTRLPKRKVNRIEDKHQMAYFEWLQRFHPTVYEVTIHVPNEGIRNQIYGHKMGIKPGMPDIVMFIASYMGGFLYHGLCIEMKRPIVKGKPKPVLSSEQSIMIARLREKYYFCQVCYSWTEAKEVTEMYLG